MNIVPAIIRNQLCSHTRSKLVLIFYPIPFLVLAIGRKQQSRTLNISILTYNSCVIQNFGRFIYAADIECISFLQKLMLLNFILC